jgi:hypothetical protein
MIVQKRKGISTFIATLLLMVLAISAGVVIYAYTMGYLGSFGGPTTMGAISVDTWAMDLTPTTGAGLSAYIRNIGKTTFQLDRVYVNGVLVTPVGSGLANLSENQVGQLSIPMSAYTWAGSTTYDVKIIGKDNTQLTFQVKK